MEERRTVSLMRVAVPCLACLRENPSIFSEKTQRMGVHPNKEHVPDAENLGDLCQGRVLDSQKLV